MDPISTAPILLPIPPDATARVIYSQQIFTEAYLNDPIRFNSDERFVPETVLQQLAPGTVVLRDPAEFLVVNTNATGSIYYPLHMVSPAYRREDVVRVIHKTFNYFR